jgi:drug/metabolite transporter (DMT)-like permease
MNPSRLKAYTLLFIVTIIWAVAGPVIKFTLEGVPTLLFLTYRFGLSAIVALIIFLITGFHFPKNPKTIFLLLIYSLFSSSISLGLLFFGLENTTVLDMSIITLMVPLLTSIAGAYFLKENITKREKIGMAIAFSGTIFTVLEPLILNGGNEIKFSGNLLIFLYLLVNILPTVLGKKLLKDGLAPSAITGYSFTIGFLSLLPILIWKTGISSSLTQIASLPIHYHLGVFFMAFISGSLAYYLFNKAQKSIEIGDASVFSYLNPIFAAPLAVFWLGEKITPMYIVGGLVIAIGVAIAEIKKRRYN